MRRDTINILIAVHTKDNTGRDVTTWSINYTIYDGFQPLKYNANYKPYGVTDKTSNVVYCRDSALMARYNLPKSDPNQFNATYRIGFNGKQYIIDSILPYQKHMEIYLELVV